MTRGKNANKVANRERVIAEREAPMRRQIAKLEAEVQKLHKENLELQAVHVEESRKLRLLIAANTSERLESAGYQIIALTEERDLALFEVSEVAKRWSNIVPKMLDLISESTGQDREDALSTLVNYTGEAPEDVFIVSDDEAIAARKFGAAGVAAMRRARRSAKNPWHLETVAGQ